MRYMLIETSPAEARLLLMAPSMQAAQLHGQLAKARGVTVIAPPVEIRGFAQLTELALQSFYRNLCHAEPPEARDELVAGCLAKLCDYPEDTTSLAELEEALARIKADAPEPASHHKSRQKGESTTARIWALAEGLTANKILAERQAVIQACLAEGINPATASTQFGKWKASKSRAAGSSQL